MRQCPEWKPSLENGANGINGRGDEGMADVKKLYQRIELAMEEKEYDEASDIARRAVKENPADGISWYYLLLADNRVDEPEAFLVWKKDWRQMEAYRQAVAHGGQAEKLVQLGKEWAYRQAKALQQQKRYEAALSYFEEAQDYRDSVELAGECRKIVEKALAEQRRLEAETEAKEAAKEKAAGWATDKESAERTKQQEAPEREPAARTSDGKRVQSGAIQVSDIEYAGKFCEEFLAKASGTEKEEAQKLMEDMGTLVTAAKWGGRLEEEEAYKELEKLSSFWRVYGAERKEGELAARLYDAKQGAAAGLPWDNGIACYWAGVAASAGNRQGCLQLGRFYETGIGVKPNFQLAGHFYKEADSKIDVEYFKDHTQAFRQLTGCRTTEGYEEVSAPPHFEMSDAARRVGSYWKLHKRTEEAKLNMERRAAARLQELLAPMKREFDDLSGLKKKIDRRDNIAAGFSLVSIVLFGIAWAIFVLFMPLFIEKYTGSRTGNLHALGILTYIPVMFLAFLFFMLIFQILPMIPINRRYSNRQSKVLEKIRKAYGQAMEEITQGDCEEYRQYTDWKSRCQEMQKALGVKTSGWRHAYLMYYSAGIHGARNPDEADQNALAMEKRDSSVKLPFVPSPITRWLMERMKEEETPRDLLELAKQHGKNSRKRRYGGNDTWQPVVALECILYHAVCMLKVEPKWSEHGFWRTNTDILRELSRIYGYGKEELHQKADPDIGLILADFAAEVYFHQYHAGRKAALSELVSTYSGLDEQEEEFWAWKAWKERCPEFAEQAVNYMIGFYGGSLFSMKDLREFIDDLLTDPKLSEANREKVKKLQADINDWEKRKREEQQAVWEQQQYQIRQAREAIAQELDRRERNLNFIFGNDYMTNEELYLSGRQSISEYVTNDIYRNFRRSEMEKKQREQEM